MSSMHFGSFYLAHNCEVTSIYEDLGITIFAYEMLQADQQQGSEGVEQQPNMFIQPHF